MGYRGVMGATPIDLDELIGANVRALRMRAGLSLDGMCDAVNALAPLSWASGSLSKAEQGGRRWRIGELAIVARVLGVGVAELLEGSGPLGEPFESFTGSELASALLASTRSRGAGVDAARVEEVKRARLEAELEAVVARALQLEGEEELEELRAVVSVDYRCALLEERDARVEEEAALFTHRVGRSPSSSFLAAARASATKELIAELSRSDSWPSIRFEVTE